MGATTESVRTLGAPPAPPVCMPEQRYSFGIAARIPELGRPCKLWSESFPDVAIRSIEIGAAVPAPGMIIVGRLKVGNVNALVGTVDAYALAKAQRLAVPVVRPSTRVLLAAAYTGLVPPGLKKGDPFTFSLTLTGVLQVFDAAV